MKAQLSTNKKNMICGAVVCFVSAFFFYYSRANIKVNTFIAGFGTDSRTVPSIIFGFMFLMGLVLLADAVVKEKRQIVAKNEFEGIAKEDIGHMLVVVVAIAVYAVLAKYVGYFTMTAIYMLFLFWYTKLNIKTAVILTFCVTLALYLLFVVALGVQISHNVWLV